MTMISEEPEPPKPIAKETTSNFYDSDSDLSDTERLIMERRRLNTEYMEQIEKERHEMLQKTVAVTKDHLIVNEPKETTFTEDENDIEMKDVLSKSLEELEAERDALLQQVRNPDPPTETVISGAAKASEFELPTRLNEASDLDNLDITRQKQEQNQDVNGDVSRLKTALESSTEDSSPCSQVG